MAETKGTPLKQFSLCGNGNTAIWFRQFGSPLQTLTIEVSEQPKRLPQQIRVRMLFAPINPSDIIPITGAYRYSVTAPRVAGYEGVGIVVEAEGDAARLIGRRVLPLRGPGTWQTFIDCDPSWVVPVPDDIPDTLAARSYINPLAAYLMLKRWPVKGKRVLLTGAGSACAALLAQWAYEAGAVEVAGIYRSPERIASLIQLGVRPISAESLLEIDALSVEADVVFDAVGGTLGTRILAAMHLRADFISYGLLSGKPVQTTSHGTQVQRFHLRDCLETTTPTEWQQWFCELWPFLRRVTLPDVTSFTLERWPEALMFFDLPGRVTKPIFTMRQDDTDA